MSEKKALRCSTCNKKVSYHFKKVNHMLQFFLSVVSCGIWLPVWMALLIKPTKFCDECNQPLWDE